jgi:hypothetical protein
VLSTLQETKKEMHLVLHAALDPPTMPLAVLLVLVILDFLAIPKATNPVLLAVITNLHQRLLPQPVCCVLKPPPVLALLADVAMDPGGQPQKKH